AGARGARIARPGPVEPADRLHPGDLAGDHQDACLPGAGQTRLRLPRAGGDPRPRGRTRLTGAGDRRASPGRGGNRDRIVAWIRACEADAARDLTHNGDNLRNGAQLVEAGVPPAPASTHVWGYFPAPVACSAGVYRPRWFEREPSSAGVDSVRPWHRRSSSLKVCQRRMWPPGWRTASTAASSPFCANVAGGRAP